jgi:hypothetical protein
MSVVHSTRELRKKRPLPEGCPVSGDQQCHIVGLNLAKRLINYYAMELYERVSSDELEALKEALNERANVECCSKRRNREDVVTEKEVLLFLLPSNRRRDHGGYAGLSHAAQRMVDSLEHLLTRLHTRMQKKGTPDTTVQAILLMIQHKRTTRCLFCEQVCSLRERGGRRTFCHQRCQQSYHALRLLRKSLINSSRV